MYTEIVALSVWTARISTRDPDAFNVTRKSGDPVFAPSWPLLRTALDRRRTGRETTPEEWKAYARTYLEEMVQSKQTYAATWNALLSRERVVLTCYCTNADRCHRKVLALFLAKYGATYHGELAEGPDQTERDLFELAMSLGVEDEHE